MKDTNKFVTYRVGEWLPSDQKVLNDWLADLIDKVDAMEVKKPFLARDLKRSEVKAIVSMGLEQSGGKYKNLLKIFNLETTDYHRFMRFLHEQDLKPHQ